MPRTIDKPEALERLEAHRRGLFAGGDGCVMCALVERARKADELLAESEHGVALLDRFGSRIGHTLIIARGHVEDATSLGWPAYACLQRLAFDASRALERELRPERVFVAVLGASSQLPMSFPHFHVHVLPVYETGEGARPAHVFSWSAGVLVYDDDEARELAARLRAAWPNER
jgi:diadenosine tetraphosphate (Ap4A) HIT family hydrolase